MIYLIIYIIGIVISWFLFAWVNDNNNDSIPAGFIFLSWISVCVVICLYINYLWINAKIFHPLLKYFKKKKK